jgi:hypothetical protein
MKETCITQCLFNYKEECLKLTCYVCYPDYLDFEFLKFHSEILSPWHFVTFWNVLPGIRKWKLCDKVFLAFQTFSPGLEKNKATKCGSENFPRTVTYILCVEKCQNHILMHSCLPIPGRPFKNVMDSGSQSETLVISDEPRIWDLNIESLTFLFVFNSFFLCFG